jgi:PEP-CTERM motif
MRPKLWLAAILLAASNIAEPARAGSTFFFSTGDPDGKMAMASRPSSAGKIEIEAADDFVLTTSTNLTSATFTGLLPSSASLSDITDVRVEIYRVFPKDSGPFDNKVPTRTNSPSDVEFADRSASAHNLTFTPGIIASSFTANNSVLNGISVHSGGDGAVTGKEVEFNVLFSTPFTLAADHYFFVPQVELSNGDFFWLSAPRPIVPPGTPFPPGFTDLQTWIRNENLAPDWLRVGTDIVGGNPAPTFNAAFSLAGSVVPEPSSVILLGLGGLGILGAARHGQRRAKG